MPVLPAPGAWSAGLVLLALLAAGPPVELSARTQAAGAPAVRPPPPNIPSPRVRAEAAIIFDPVTGNAVWELNAREPRPIASITKVMTAMLFLDQEPDLSRDVVISRRDVRSASTTYLRRGERVSLRDLLHLALVASDNVAARVLARSSPWGTKRFISRMNAMAAELGLEQTRFTDPSGLHEGNVSSAHDVSRLIAAAGQATPDRADHQQAFVSCPNEPPESNDPEHQPPAQHASRRRGGEDRFSSTRPDTVWRP